jgi:hypothetical protein
MLYRASRLMVVYWHMNIFVMNDVAAPHNTSIWMLYNFLFHQDLKGRRRQSRSYSFLSTFYWPSVVHLFPPSKDCYSSLLIMKKRIMLGACQRFLYQRELWKINSKCLSIMSSACQWSFISESCVKNQLKMPFLDTK